MMSEGAPTKILQKVELLFLIGTFVLCMIGQKASPAGRNRKGVFNGNRSVAASVQCCFACGKRMSRNM